MNASTQLKSPLLLKSKLFPPALDKSLLLTRYPLIEQLSNERMRRCLILSAPAGFGKSTTLSLFQQHLMGLSANTVWLSCDEADSELQRLVQYIVAGIREKLPSFGENILRILTDEVIQSSQDLLEALLGEMRHIEGRWYLFLDDFHRLQNPSLHTCLQYFIEHLPEHVHVVLGSRTQLTFLSDSPPLADHVFALSADSMRLLREESDRFLLDLKKLRLQPDELALLYGRTEGWIAALHLASLALQHTDDRLRLLTELSGTERNIADYLADDVLANLPDDEQQFIDKTSVLDEFNVELCNEITGRMDAAAILQRLQHEQLLILPLDAEGKWFRYHHLFAEFLQGRLARYADPSVFLAIAARWHDRESMSDHAIKYAVKAQDYQFAAALLEKQGSTLIAGNRVYGVLALLKTIPLEVIQSFAVFQIFYAWKLAFELRYVEAETLIDDLTAKLKQGAFKPQHFGLIQLAGAAQVLKALILFQQEKLQECIAMTEKWLARIPADQPVFVASLACLKAGSHVLAGSYEQAAETIERVRAHLDKIGSEYFRTLVTLIETVLYKERGKLDEAFCLEEATRAYIHKIYGPRSRVGGSFIQGCADIVYECNQAEKILPELSFSTTYKDVSTVPEMLSRGWLVVVKTQFFSGDTNTALVQLEDWLSTLETPGYERPYVQAICCKIQLLLWLRRINDARRVYRQLKAHLDTVSIDQFEDADVALFMTEVRLALFARRPDTVLPALEQRFNDCAGAFRQDRRLRLAVLLAVTYWQKGLHQEAFSLLQQTMEQGWGCGYRRLFMDEAIWLLPLWQGWLSAEPGQAVKWADLTALLNQQCQLLSVNIESLDGDQDISRREQEILRLVSAGLSNRDIAQAVHLSEATVKWHLHNLFTKLGVKSRTQAVLKGKSLGILAES